MKTFLLDRRKAEPLKEPQRRIVCFHVDADRFAGFFRFRHDLAQQKGAGAPVAVFRQYRNINDVKFFA